MQKNARFVMPRSISALLLLAIPFFSTAQQQINITKISQYSTVLNTNDDGDYASFHLLDSAVAKNKIFFTGEFHEEPGNTILQWKIFRYLNQKEGLRTMVFELPVGIGYLVNYYLQHNDSDSYFDAVESSMDIDDRIFFARIFEFNKTLPEGKKIIIEGIDYEKVFELSREALQLILKHHPEMKNAGPDVNAVTKMNGRTRDTTLQHWAIRTLAKVKSDSTDLRSWLADDYIYFKEILRGIDCDEFEDAETSRTALDKRELFLHDNFSYVLRKYPGEKIFGQFGETHTCLQTHANWCYEQDWSSFIAHANSDQGSAVKDSILIIAYVYRNNDYPGNYFPSLPFSDYFTLMAIDHNAPFVLAGPNQKLQPPGDSTGKKCQYMVFVDFTKKDLSGHYHDPVNDPYDAIRNSGYYVDAVYAAFNQWKHSDIELGYFIGYQYYFNDELVGAGVSLDYVLDEKKYGAKTFFCFNLDPVHAGLNITYHTDLTHHAFGVLPQLGLAWRGFSLSYGYDWKFAGSMKKEGDTHMISLKYVLPFLKQ
jgi:hypothetical protein